MDHFRHSLFSCCRCGRAFAKLGQADEKMFAALARVVEWQGLSNTAGAFATENLLDEKIFRALARGPERRVSEFNAQSNSEPVG